MLGALAVAVPVVLVVLAVVELPLVPVVLAELPLGSRSGLGRGSAPVWVPQRLVGWVLLIQQCSLVKTLLGVFALAVVRTGPPLEPWFQRGVAPTVSPNLQVMGQGPHRSTLTTGAVLGSGPCRGGKHPLR